MSLSATIIHYELTTSFGDGKNKTALYNFFWCRYKQLFCWKIDFEAVTVLNIASDYSLLGNISKEIV